MGIQDEFCAQNLINQDHTGGPYKTEVEEEEGGGGGRKEGRSEQKEKSENHSQRFGKNATTEKQKETTKKGQTSIKP